MTYNPLPRSSLPRRDSLRSLSVSRSLPDGVVGDRSRNRNRARKLLDNYVDETTLLQLSKRNPKVNCVIYTEKVTGQLSLDLEKHNAQYPA